VLQQFGPPPSILWIRCGNTSNAHVRRLLRGTLESALKMIAGGESLVEIDDQLATT
jgi:predicted nuclease of predicted toxin-antitoxin system